jgi:hypothetical protein
VTASGTPLTASGAPLVRRCYRTVAVKSSAQDAAARLFSAR